MNEEQQKEASVAFYSDLFSKYPTIIALINDYHYDNLKFEGQIWGLANSIMIAHDNIQECQEELQGYISPKGNGSVPVAIQDSAKEYIRENQDSIEWAVNQLKQLPRLFDIQQVNLKWIEEPIQEIESLDLGKYTDLPNTLVEEEADLLDIGQSVILSGFRITRRI